MPESLVIECEENGEWRFVMRMITQRNTERLLEILSEEYPARNYRCRTEY